MRFWIVDYHQLRLFFDGMLCMMVLYALFSYALHRKAIYWQYSLYIVCMIITFYWDDIDYGMPDYLPGTNLKVVIVESIAFLLYIRFAILLIEIPRLDPFSHLVLKIMTIVLGVEMAGDILLFSLGADPLLKSNIYILFRCMLAIGALIVMPRIVRLRQAAVGCFIVGSFFFVMGCLMSLGINFVPEIFNRNPSNAISFPITFMELGAILEVLCFTMGMSVKNRKNEQEKIEAQKQLIEQLRENDRKQSALIRIRDDISRDLHDELGADLSSINLMSHAALRQIKNLDPNALSTITLIGKTSRKVIARMRGIIWSLHSVHDSVGNFSYRAKETAYELFELYPIELHMDMPAEEIDSRIPTEYKRNLFLVYKEILHNIVRHSNAQNVYIRLFTKDNYLNLIVRDDGVGFIYQENEHTGNGLLNLKQRTSVFAGKLILESRPGAGTMVSVQCPINRNVLSL